MIPATPITPFGELMPDMGALDAGGALMIADCVSYGGKYRPLEELEEIAGALPERCIGGFSYRDAAGTVTIFAATRAKIYKLNGTTWDDVTRVSGGDYGSGVDDFWCFTNFGGLIIATNYVDDIQAFNVATDTNFSLMSATAPRARYLAVVKNFLVLIDTVDEDGALGYRVRWSPFKDPQGDWTPDPTVTQADFQDLYDTKYSNTYITPFGDYGIIVQGRAIWRMDYVGGDTIFEFNRLDEGRGSILSRSCIYNGQSVFMLSEDGFYELNASQMIPIGDKKIDKTFFEMFDQSYDFNLNVAVDPFRKLVLWSFPSINATDGEPDMAICYSWTDKRWTFVYEEIQMLFPFVTVNYTLEGLDDISLDLDALPFSLDSRAWTGGKNILGAIKANGTLALFTGNARAATIQTSEVRPNAGGSATLAGVMPYIEGGTVRGRIGIRNLLSQSHTWSPWVDVNPYTGELDFTLDAIFMRAEIEVSGSWQIAHGIGIRQQESGAA